MKRAASTKRPVGRPSKYDPAFCEEMIAFCREGYSITAFAGKIGVARETITGWANEHPEFSLAVKTAKAASALWWEDRGRKVGERGGGPGTATMIIFKLKNTAAEDHSEKVINELQGPGGGPIQTQEVSARDILAGRIAGIAARKGEK